MVSSSASDNSNTSTNQQHDERIATGDYGVVLRLDSGASISMLDPGIAAVINEFGNTALEAVQKTFEESIGVVTQQQDANREALTGFINGVKTETAQGVDKIIKAATVLGVVYFAARAWGNWK